VASKTVNAGAVEALLRLTEAALSDERERGKNLDTKTASLAAFSGAILTLNLAFGQAPLEHPLGKVGDWLVPVAFIVAALALVTSASLAVVGVLRPQPQLALEATTLRGEVDQLLFADKGFVEGRLLNTLTAEVITPERERNDGKAWFLSAAVIALGVGLIAIAVEATTFGLHQLGV
jgi:hypothetical protein